MGSIGKYELELSISEYEKAKSELRIAELNVERCEIRTLLMVRLRKLW